MKSARSVSLALTAISLASLAAACGPSTRDGTGDAGDGTGVDAPGTGSNTGTDGGTDPATGCDDASKLVYVVDQNYKMSSFAPATGIFTPIGTGALNCPGAGAATPFSMGVDRDAKAWVLYTNGKIYTVDTTTLACAPSAFSPNAGFDQFGMGFSTTSATSTTDQLFVSGGNGTVDPEANSSLGRLDTATLQVSNLGILHGSPELTGTGAGELWAFFPGTNPRVTQLDKSNAGILTEYSNITALNGTPSAWAFAAWGGDFFVFLAKATETRTTVYHIGGPARGAMAGKVLDTKSAGNLMIVGAGVSTCAPVTVGRTVTH